MKSLKTTILSLALLAGVTGAFATKAANTEAAKQGPSYNWTKPGAPPFTGTVSAAKINYNCSGNGLQCAVGVDPNQVLPNQIIRFN